MAVKGPKCEMCGATKNTEFPLLPKSKGYRFGMICVECDDKQKEGKT